MIIGVAILILAAFIFVAFYFLQRFAGEEQPGIHRWFLLWVGKGIGMPLLLWVIWNLGILPGLPPMILQMAQALAGRNRVEVFLVLTSAAILIIGSFWAAVTLAWFIVLLAGREEIRIDVLGACLVWSLLMLPVAAFIIYLGGWGWAGFAVFGWLLPIAHASLPLAAIKKLGPFYSRAVAKMKMGKYEDAEWEVLHELEKRENDFEGWMMLAELYANHFDDLAGAERTIHDICQQPDVTPSQVAVALHRLADWQLKNAQDPVAARRSLEEICQRMPDTHLATMARHRINQLPASREELQEQSKGRRFHLPALNDDLQETTVVPETQTSREAAAAKANRCVEQLEKDPNNVSAREELARLFAEHLNRARLGIEQIELLLDMPDQTEQKTAEWLSLMAAWRLKYLQDTEGARTVLERLVHEHPQTPQAFAAQRHLKLMEVEQRLRKMRAPKDHAPDMSST